MSWVSQASSTRRPSLSTGRENVAEYGACLPGVVGETREPTDGDERDPNYPYE